VVTFPLNRPEAHHLIAVSRFRPGDAVSLFNGDGREYSAHVIEIGRRRAEVAIEGISTPQRELTFSLEVAAPLPKGDRSQFLIEKLTELGVTSFVPLECERSIVQVRDAKLEKLQRHVIEASKQCGRNVLMAIEAPVPWKDYRMKLKDDETGWIAHPGIGKSDSLAPAATAMIRVAVGAEGGFSDAEIAGGIASGWQMIDLGPRILRVETAALVLAHLAIVKRV
jgi:16S rRNA (uracil1498-N3)-methyltransferase